MAENINIGNTPDRKYERELALYSAFSEVDDRYVDEMLDDSKAREIRAANRRKAHSVRNWVAACAAVFAIVVGISVIPHGSSSDMATANHQKSAEARSDNAVKEEAAGETNDEADDVDGGSAKPNAPTTTAAEAPRMEEEERAEEAPAEYSFDEAPSNTVESHDRDVTSDKKKAEGKKVQSLKPESTEPADAAKDDNRAQMSTGEYVTLSDGTGWFVGEYIDRTLVGELVSKENGYEIYELEGFDPRFMTAMINNDGCRAMITDDFRTENLAELAEGLNFREHLICDKYYGSNDWEPVSEEMFRNSTLKLMTDYGGNYKLDPTFGGGTGSMGNYMCRIGTKDDTYIGEVNITVFENAVIVTCFNASAMFVEK